MKQMVYILRFMLQKHSLTDDSHDSVSVPNKQKKDKTKLLLHKQAIFADL